MPVKLRIATMLLSTLLASAHAGCFSKPAEPHVTGDGGPRDAVGNDGADSGSNQKPADAGGCTTRVIADFSNSGTGCPSGLSLVSSAGTSVGYNGMLNVVLPSTPGVSAGCRTPGLIDFTGGIGVDITRLPTVMQASMTFQVAVQDGTVPVLLQFVRGSMSTSISITCPGSTANSALLGFSAPFKVRMIATGANSDVINVDVMSSNSTFGTIQSCPLTGSAGSATVEITGSSGSGATDTVSFDNLEGCPAP